MKTCYVPKTFSKGHMWKRQGYRPEVWIEKDALSGVIQGVCEENDVPYFSCRGYTSLSEMWRASLRLRSHAASGQIPYIIHFGDHDPSGIDMSRDILERLQQTFMADFEFKRVALTMDQIREYNPPPNPAKVTDSRYEAYLAEYGDESWELDALEPTHFRRLIEERLIELRKLSLWEEDREEKARVKATLVDLAAGWESFPQKMARLEELETALPHQQKAFQDLLAERDKLAGELTVARKAARSRGKKPKPG